MIRLWASFKDVLFLKKRNLKTKMALSVSALFVVASALISFFAIAYLEREFKQSIANQQNALARNICDSLDDKLLTAQQTLLAVSSQLTPAILADHDKVQLFLNDKDSLKIIFTDKLFILDPQGTMIAESPLEPDLRGHNFASREYFQKTVSSRKPVISAPFRSAMPDKRPVIALTKPIYDNRGNLVCILAGTMRLIGTNFLGELPKMRIGKKGYPFLITAADGTFIVHPDSKRILMPAPRPGVNKLFDRALAGFEGSDDTVNSYGITMLTSFRHLRSTNWILGVNLPADEAYAAVYQLRLYLVGGIAAGTLVTLVIVWLLMQRLTLPLITITRHVEGMGGEAELKPLDGTDSSYEIDTLTLAFNNLIQTVQQQQQTLQQNERRYRIVADNTYDWECWLSPEQCFVYSSPSCKRITGYEAIEFLANPKLLEEIIHPDDIRMFELLRNKAEDLTGVHQTEFRIVRKDGGIRWVAHLCQSIYSDTGTYLGLRCNNSDITAQKQIETELQQGEERYRTLFDESPFGVVLVDPETFEVLHFNLAACKNLGYEPDEFSRLHVMDFAVMEKQEEIKMRSEQVLHHGGVSFETIHRTKQGALRNVMIDLKLITVTGKPMIQSIIRDITESKRSQQLMELYLYALDNARDQIFMNDRTSRFIYVNQAACTTLGYSREELLGMRVSDIDPNFPTEAWEDHWQDLQTQDGLRVETSHRSKDGKSYPVEMSLKSFVYDKAEYLLAVARDLTEQKQQEAEKLEMERRLLHSQKLESLGVLAGGIAHDFNNILTAIVGNADLALMRISKDSPGVANLYRIEEAAARAADLAKQMLAYSGKGKFLVEHINLNHLLEDMLHLLEVSISKKSELRLNLIPNLPSVKVDTTQIRQIVMNLVINASEAIGDNNGVIAITTGYVDCDQSYLKDIWLEDNLDEGLYVYLEISDTGCGMDRETLTKIFDPFFTTKFTGRGLGMAAVLGIVRGHKGAIKVHSEPNKGSSFKILLPASDRPAELINHVSEQGDWCGRGTVMLVDDEETVRSIGKEMLQELGFTTITASDGREALEIFKTTPDIAFIILDLTMPNMDGEQCFRELREINPDVKVIISSGFSEQEVTQKFVGKGMAGFIQKPYKLSMLKDAINSLDLSAPN